MQRWFLLEDRQMLMKSAPQRCDAAPAMQMSERRVAESCVDNALKRCAATGLDVPRASIHTMLAAEMKLSELGVTCDLVGRMIELEKQCDRRGLRSVRTPRFRSVA